MRELLLDGFNLAGLFPDAAKPISFAEDPRRYIPVTGSIIYSVWNLEAEFVYIGIAGLQKDSSRRNPVSRMVSHASGRRSGDQFCIYVHDHYVVPELIKCGDYIPKNGYLDILTRDYIRKHLSYRFLDYQTDDSDTLVRSLEKQIKSGVLGFKPLLNGDE